MHENFLLVWLYSQQKFEIKIFWKNTIYTYFFPEDTKFMLNREYY